MKVDVEKVIGASVIIGGIIFGYGQLSNKVDNIQEYNDSEIRTLADTNMNDIIKLKTQMDLLVTPDMRIVPSPVVNAKLDRLMRFMEDEKRRKEDRRRMEERMDEEEHRRDEEDDRW